MAETKYDKYFIFDTPANPLHPKTREKGGASYWNTLFINDELNQTIKGAYYLETNLVMRKSYGLGNKPHNHTWDEYLIFLGTNPEDPFDLGGEVEFWLEDENHIFTKSCSVFVPRGMYHCPVIFHRVDRPFIWITTGNTLRYRHLSYSKEPKWADLPEFDDDKVGLPPIV